MRISTLVVLGVAWLAWNQTAAQEISDCSGPARPANCLFRFVTVSDPQPSPLKVKCASAAIAQRVPTVGTISRKTDCITTVNTALGPVEVVGDLFSVYAPGGTSLFVTLDSPPFQEYFGLPYIVIVNPDGDPVAAKVGTTPIGNGGNRAEINFAIPTTGKWFFLVTGIGGQLETPAGEYTTTADFVQVLRRRSARH